MPIASRFLAVVLLGFIVVALMPAADPPAKTPPTKDQIAAWIKQLSADEFEKREEASQKLWDAGQPAEAALEEAAKSKDEEVRRRAKEILGKFKYGIYPDTPKKVVDLVTQFQTADDATRTNIIKELFEAGTPGCRALMKLASVESEAAARERIMQVIAQEVHHAVPALLSEGNFDTLEMFLDLSVAGDVRAGAPDFTAYYLLRGKLDAGMEHVKTKKEFDERHKQELLAHLSRAKGDLKAAVAAADKAAELAKKAEAEAPADKKAQATDIRDAAQQLAEDLLFEAGEWKELSKRYQANQTGNPIQKLGHAATYHRLAGNKKQLDEAVAAIIKYPETVPAGDKSWAAFFAAKALFLNDRPEEALKLLKENGRPDFAFEILCVQLRFGEAFELLEKARKGATPTGEIMEILAARTLYSLGEKDKARPMFAKVAEGIKPAQGQNADNSWIEDLIDAEIRVGLHEEAFEHTGKALDQFKDAGWASRLFPRLFPGRTNAAEMWFTQLNTAAPTVAASEHLKQLRLLLEGRTPEKDLKKLLTDTETAARAKNGEELDHWIEALVDTALLYKKDAAAQAMLEKTATPAARLRLGDLFAQKKQWDKAAEQYKTAWEKDKHQALALYLYGQALTKSGKEAEGKKLMEQSHWILLGDEEGRAVFAEALAERGEVAASHRENELLLNTSDPASSHTGEALRLTALNALAKKQFLQGAQWHERALLRCLRTDINFRQKGAYVGVPAHVHRLRARGLLEAGKLDEARQEIALTRTLLPGDDALAILLVAALEKGGQANDAKDLFENSLNAYEKLCKEYPRCAWAHNEAAWVSVCCGRNLEAAKDHALKATTLAPTNAGHLDTLAEIYFQLGDKSNALATAKKVVELDPKRVYFRKQLKRIEAGDPKAERSSDLDE